MLDLLQRAAIGNRHGGVRGEHGEPIEHALVSSSAEIAGEDADDTPAKPQGEAQNPAYLGDVREGCLHAPVVEWFHTRREPRLSTCRNLSDPRLSADSHQ